MLTPTDFFFAFYFFSINFQSFSSLVEPYVFGPLSGMYIPFIINSKLVYTLISFFGVL